MGYKWKSTCVSVMTVFILFPEVAHEVAALGKEEVAHPSTKGNGEEEPAIVGHGHQHEQVRIAHLDHMENRLQEVDAHADGIVLDSEGGRK